MTGAQPKVSIITINYNSENETLDLLKSLSNVTYSNIEIIVIDNQSTVKPSAELVNYPGIKFIQSESNLGFAGGNNLGIQVATGDFILLLNNDTEVVEGFLEPLIQAFRENSDVGIVSPKIVFHNRGEIIQFAGFSPIHPITARGFSIGYGQVDEQQYNKSGYTNRAHGAAMMFSRKVLDVVGLLPEVYFLYYEEMDYCEIVKRAGFKIWYESQSKIYHKESMSVGKHGKIKAYYMHRNRLLYVRRNSVGINKLLAMCYVVAIAYPKEFLLYCKKGQWSNASQIIRGLFWNLTHGTA